MTVSLAIADHVARVTIDRPEVLNAVDEATERRLNEIWEQIEGDRDIRVVVLTGAGDRAFSAGADMKSVDKSGAEYWLDPRPNGFGGISLRTSLDVPVIARVNGHALGGGFEMVLGCDIVIAAEEATMGLPEPTVGRLPLDGGIVLLPRLIPKKLAMAMLLTGRRIAASEAADLHLVNEVVPRAELDEAVDRWVGWILACAPLSLRAAKQIVQRTGHLTPQEARAQKLPALVEALVSEDGLEGVRAFQEKRKPQWAGR